MYLVRSSSFLRETRRGTAKGRKKKHNFFSIPTLFSSPAEPLASSIQTMISLRSSAGVRVAPATAALSSSSSRAAIALRPAAPALSLTVPARVSASASSRRSLKSLAPRAAAGSPPAFGAYGESRSFSFASRAREEQQSGWKRTLLEALRAIGLAVLLRRQRCHLFSVFSTPTLILISLSRLYTPRNRRRRPHQGHRCRRRRWQRRQPHGELGPAGEEGKKKERKRGASECRSRREEFP